MSSLSRRAGFILGGLGALLMAASPAAADAPPQLGLKALDVPGTYYDLTLAPGQTRELRVQLGNYGPTQAVARTYAADVYSMVNGGMGVRLDGEPTSGATSWLDYPAQTLTLDAHQAVTQTFQVHVPADARPGDYITAIVIAGQASISQAGDVGFRQVTRQAVAVALAVPGARSPGLVLAGASLRSTPAGASFIDFGVANTGNVRLHPGGSFVLRDAAGNTLARSAVQMDAVYAGTATTLAVPLAVALAPGHYTAALSLTDPASGIHAESGAQPLEVSAPLAPVPSSGTNAAPDRAPEVLIVNAPLSLPTLGVLGALMAAVSVGAVALLTILGRRRRERAVGRP